MYKLKIGGRFKKAYKKCVRRGLDISKFETVLRLLVNGETLPEEYDNHLLHGNYEGWNDCHIESDWILIWKYQEEELLLHLLDTGTHSDLFGKNRK